MNILVTGGSGTIGRAICKDLIARRCTPIVLSRDHGAQLENCPGCQLEVGDVERRSDLERLLNRQPIDGIIHAAANKHVHACEVRPSLAVKANILGTLNVLELARDYKLNRVVLVSTDKACNHEQVYGMSKYFGEQMAREFAKDGLKVNNVRFGNVFGSQGSVVQIWSRCIALGQPIECRGARESPSEALYTYPLRYAMLPSEAAEFCTKVYHGDYPGGATIVKPMRVVDIYTLAQAMTHGTSSKIITRTLREGENMVEHLLTGKERNRATLHDGEWTIKPGWNNGLGPVPPSSTHLDVKTEPEEAMDYEETAQFLARVREEM